MQSKQIKLFKLSSSLTTDASRIEFQFIDGTGTTMELPSHRFTAAVATLQASSISYYFYDPAMNFHFISSAPDAPGLV